VTILIKQIAHLAFGFFNAPSRPECPTPLPPPPPPAAIGVLWDTVTADNGTPRSTGFWNTVAYPGWAIIVEAITATTAEINVVTTNNLRIIYAKCITQLDKFFEESSLFELSMPHMNGFWY
jgi:hypothetical protein